MRGEEMSLQIDDELTIDRERMISEMRGAERE
ncbi:hypothetical protein OIU78_001941 [Salix suchowensis]|nr:hypothetical protein OIU78_001941 [Salix suchowensis]